MLHGNGAAAASIANIVPVQLTPGSPTLNNTTGGGTTHYQLTSATIHAAGGGTGYGNAQTFNVTVAGGTSTTASVISVTTNAGGVVTTVNSVGTAGDYTVLPTISGNLVTGDDGSDHGTGLSLDLTYTHISHTYYVRTTYVFSFGEQPASAEANRSVDTANLLTVASPAANSYATGWNVYAGASGGSEVLQNVAPIALGTNWTMPASLLASNGALGTTLTIDMNVSEDWLATVGDSFTLANPANIAAGRRANLWITQDGTGSRVCTFGSQWQAAGSTSTIALSTSASVKDLLKAICDTATSISTQVFKAISH